MYILEYIERKVIWRIRLGLKHWSGHSLLLLCTSASSFFCHHLNLQYVSTPWSIDRPFEFSILKDLLIGLFYNPRGISFNRVVLRSQDGNTARPLTDPEVSAGKREHVLYLNLIKNIWTITCSIVKFSKRRFYLSATSTRLLWLTAKSLSLWCCFISSVTPLRKRLIPATQTQAEQTASVQKTKLSVSIIVMGGFQHFLLINQQLKIFHFDLIIRNLSVNLRKICPSLTNRCWAEEETSLITTFYSLSSHFKSLCIYSSNAASKALKTPDFN